MRRRNAVVALSVTAESDQTPPMFQCLSLATFLHKPSSTFGSFCLFRSCISLSLSRPQRTLFRAALTKNLPPPSSEKFFRHSHRFHPLTFRTFRPARGRFFRGHIVAMALFHGSPPSSGVVTRTSPRMAAVYIGPLKFVLCVASGLLWVLRRLSFCLYDP